MALGATAAVIAAPYIFGWGSDMFWSFINSCSGTGSGLAGAATNAIGSIPGIGPALTAGGWVSMLAPGIVGLGGALLGNYIHKHYDKHGHIPWGKVIRYASLATSVLIALPSLLSGISTGLVFLAFAAGGIPAAYTMISHVAPTIGLMGGTSLVAAGAGLSGMLAHTLACGAALLPTGMMMGKSGHMDMDGAPFRVESLPHAAFQAGKPCELSFRLLDSETGRPLSPEEFKITHTQPLHTMLVDSTLTDYHHLHPQYDPASGNFTCSFTPRSAMPYTLWNEGQLADAKMASNVREPLSPLLNYAPPARVMPTQTVKVSENIVVHIAPNMPLRKGESGMCDIAITDAQGRPLQGLEPIMGASAHLVGFSADGKTSVHAHAMDEATSEGLLQFQVTPEAYGGMKFFLQFRYGAQEYTVPFGQRVLPSMQLQPLSRSA